MALLHYSLPKLMRVKLPANFTVAQYLQAKGDILHP
jgi:hypothetical protein